VLTLTSDAQARAHVKPLDMGLSGFGDMIFFNDMSLHREG